MNGYILARALVVCTGFIWVGPIQFCCIVLHPPFLLSFYFLHVYMSCSLMSRFSWIVFVSESVFKFPIHVII